MFNQLKTWTTALAIGAVSLSAYATPVSPDTVDRKDPKVVVKAAVDATVDIFKSAQKGGKKVSDNKEAITKQVETYVLPYFSTKYISQQILGPYYNKASKSEFADFEKAIQKYMVNAYIEGMSFYKKQSVEVGDAKLNGDRYADVAVKIIDSRPITVLFKLVKYNSGAYYVYDFTAEGISIVVTKAQEWQPVLRTQGVAGLTKYINEHNTNILGDFAK